MGLRRRRRPGCPPAGRRGAARRRGGWSGSDGPVRGAAGPPATMRSCSPTPDARVGRRPGPRAPSRPARRRTRAARGRARRPALASGVHALVAAEATCGTLERRLEGLAGSVLGASSECHPDDTDEHHQPPHDVCSVATRTRRSQGDGWRARDLEFRYDGRWARTMRRYLPSLLLGLLWLTGGVVRAADPPAAPAMTATPDPATVGSATLLNGTDTLLVDGERLDVRMLRGLYEPRGYHPLWAGRGDAAKRGKEVAAAIDRAAAHGLNPAT